MFLHQLQHLVGFNRALTAQGLKVMSAFANPHLLLDPQDAARKSSACPNFFRLSISASGKTTHCLIWPSRFPDPAAKNWRLPHATTAWF